MRPMSSLVELIACPVCHGSLSLDGVLLVCEDCNLDYPVQDGVPVLLDEESRSVLGPALDKYEERYRSPDQTGIVRRVYEGIYPSVDMRFLGRVRGIRHHYAALGAFLQSFPAEARILDLGSGAGRRLDDRSYNLDIDVYPEVDIVGDALKLPLKDSCWDGVVVQMVAEHVPDPFRLASEINRILVPNGRVFCDAPFQFHQHGEADYFRYTGAGLKAIFRGFTEVESGVSVGPGSNLRLLMVEYFSLALSFGIRPLEVALSLLIAWVTLPIEWIDRLSGGVRAASSIATAVYFVGRKPGE